MKNKKTKIKINDYAKKIDKRAKYALIPELMNRHPINPEALRTIELILFFAFITWHRLTRGY